MLGDMCDPMWNVSPRSGEACCELQYSVYLLRAVGCALSQTTARTEMREFIVQGSGGRLGYMENGNWSPSCTKFR